MKDDTKRQMEPEIGDEACLCEFRDGCGGLGSLVCQGCGGDLCICICGGEAECYGCEDCDYGDDGEVAYG